ncbi:hypothetical protein STAFG_8112 [Streptomyces afghaniensis 772]|uniref:Uncharacterized protein n=1 Tax=Streptomyces afghaniensis 772 TaxID=1283301 RepID=S4NAB3_9ACTN|nr:hypothetical protein STAFG_8112 [Streptomyces afghaniensis 772]
MRGSQPSDAVAGAGSDARAGAGRAAGPSAASGASDEAETDAPPPAVPRSALRVERGALAAGGSSSGSMRVSR